MKIIRSKIQPVGKGLYYYWADLSVDKDGEVLKYYDSDTNKWLPLNNAENVRLDERLDNHDEQLADHDTRIKKNAKDIADEINRATTAEGNLQKAIDKVAYDLNEFILGEDDLDNVIDRWQEVVKFLENITEDESLAGIVAAINQSIADEVTRAKAAELKLSSDLSVEIERAKDAEKAIQDQLDRDSALVLPEDFNDIVDEYYKVIDNAINYTDSVYNPSNQYYDVTSTVLSVFDNNTIQQVYNFFKNAEPKKHAINTTYSGHVYDYNISVQERTNSIDYENGLIILVEPLFDTLSFELLIPTDKSYIKMGRVSKFVTQHDFMLYEYEFDKLNLLNTGDNFNIREFRSTIDSGLRLTSCALDHINNLGMLVRASGYTDEVSIPVSMYVIKMYGVGVSRLIIELNYIAKNKIHYIKLEQVTNTDPKNDNYIVTIHKITEIKDYEDLYYTTTVHPWYVRKNDTFSKNDFININGEHPDLSRSFLAFYQKEASGGNMCYPISVNFDVRSYGPEELYLRYSFVDKDSAYAGDYFATIKAISNNDGTYKVEDITWYSPLDSSNTIDSLPPVITQFGSYTTENGQGKITYNSYAKTSDGTYRLQPANENPYLYIPQVTDDAVGLMSPAYKNKLDTLPADAYSKSETDTLLTTAGNNTTAVNTKIDNHIANESNPHNVTKTQVGLSNVTNDAQVKRTEIGVANGVATLDTNGKVPASQLPSYVDDVVEANDKASLPATGETGKIYVTKNDNLTYRWGGTEYVEISSSLALGETTSTAYAGDKGKATTDALNNHKADHNNPHQVTKTQVGLGNVDNTSDANKPVSTATQTALNNKVDKVNGKGLSTEDFTTDLKNKLNNIAAGAQVNSITGVKGDSETTYRTGNVNITKANIGLSNVDNTSDINKPISTAVQTELNALNATITALTNRIAALESSMSSVQSTYYRIASSNGDTVTDPQIWTGSKSQYDAITTKQNDVIYMVKE